MFSIYYSGEIMIKRHKYRKKTTNLEKSTLLGATFYAGET